MPDAPEFSRPLALGRILAAPRQERLVATGAECAALAERLGILAVERMGATLQLTPAAEGVVEVTGTLDAAVVQACVVTLEPVVQAVHEPVRWRLLPPGREPQDGPEDPWDEIPTDGTGLVDLGELAAEQLALALDPYPRAPDAVLPAGLAPAGAFAALAGLRRPN